MEVSEQSVLNKPFLSLSPGTEKNLTSSALSALQHGGVLTEDFTHRGCGGWMIEADEAPSHPYQSLHLPPRQSRLWSLWPRGDWWGGPRCHPWRGVNWTQKAAPVCVLDHFIVWILLWLSLSEKRWTVLIYMLLHVQQWHQNVERDYFYTTKVYSIIILCVC